MGQFERLILLHPPLWGYRWFGPVVGHLLPTTVRLSGTAHLCPHCLQDPKMGLATGSQTLGHGYLRSD